MLKIIFILIVIMNFNCFSIEQSGSYPYPWRTKIGGTGSCWNEVTCQRALLISHGGAWTLTEPYSSFPAFERAYKEKTDCIKGDYRVSEDNYGVIVHSSPLKWYESLNCDGKYVDKMKMKEITQNCDMYLTGYHFMSFNKLVEWTNDKVILMLCMKNISNTQNAIDDILRVGAENRVFLEIGVPSLVEIIPTLKNWEKIWYLAEGRHKDDIDLLLNCNNSKLLERAFMFEFDHGWKDWNISLSDTIKRIHSKGVRTLMPTSPLPSTKEQKDIFEMGIDVVYSYDTYNGVKARTIVDIERGIDPP